VTLCSQAKSSSFWNLFIVGFPASISRWLIRNGYRFSVTGSMGVMKRSPAAFKGNADSLPSIDHERPALSAG
jgi:hypothetical protein